VSVGAGSPIGLGTLDLCFFFSEFSLLLDKKNVRKFGEMCFSIVILTNFAIFGAKFSKISRSQNDKKTLLWISVFFPQFCDGYKTDRKVTFSQNPAIF
jgi:hypothetical protein